jgi:uncharacterized protein with PIN domain
MSETLTESTSADTIVVNPQVIALENKIAELKTKLSEAILFEGDLEFQNYIENPPVQNPKALYDKACANDGVTISTWFDTWIKYIKENNEKYDFKANSAYQEFGKSALKPVMVIGAGPSLKRNVKVLAKEKGNIITVACLHAFAFLEDNGAGADYYVNLDSGPITIEEMCQGGKEKPEYYWNLSKDRVLITTITGHPDLLAKWQGKKLFYGVMASTKEFADAYAKITDFNLIFSVGGNTLGACLYFAKAVLGGNPIVYLGADFSFGLDKKFHSWDSPYDTMYSGLQTAYNVHGMKVATWPSYYNFKCWFEYIACGGAGNQPGMYINCTEGGILGSYAEGNIRQIAQMKLKDFFWSYNLHKRLPEMVAGGLNDYKFLF